MGSVEGIACVAFCLDLFLFSSWEMMMMLVGGGGGGSGGSGEEKNI